MSFKALVLRKENDVVTSKVEELTENDLPEGDVLVSVEYSTLNYKDGLCLGKGGGLVKEYPHIAGIDFAGVVETSSDDRFSSGDRVVLTGWRVGEVHWGGYSKKARVKADWLVKLPENLSTENAMIVGTAGFTAMLAIQVLENHGLSPDQEKEILVTGATGGVGSVATLLLSSLGYAVAGVTGKKESENYLKDLGASRVLLREELSEPSSRPLDRETWSGAIDSVGGTTLSRLLTQMAYGSSVAAVGLAGGSALSTTVIPFLLRGVNLLGIDSVMQPTANREKAWERITKSLPLEKLSSVVVPAKLEDLPALGKDILAGKIRGRVLVDILNS